MRRLFAIAVLAASGAAPAGADDPQIADIAFTAECGRVFDARLVLPDDERRNGAGVLLIGGGFGNDLAWSVPGSLVVDGAPRQVTITGETHEDAPRIAGALAARGFTVMHFTTVARDDPKRDRWPYEATVFPMEEQVAHARAALAALRDSGRIDRDRVALVGHSLGAMRACVLAADDEGVVALVLLAAAQLTRTGRDGGSSHRSAAASFMVAADADGDGTCGPAELARSRGHLPAAIAEQELVALDFDHDGALRRWEITAALARAARRELDPETLPARDRYGLPWSEDVLARRARPALIVYGTLDDGQTHHAPVIADRIAAERLRHVELVLVPEVGHQLGAERAGRVGPVAGTVLEIVAEWLGGAAVGDAAAGGPD